MTDVYKPKFTQALRIRVGAALGVCPTCGQARVTTREMAEQIGVRSHTSLWRFMKGGKPSADLVDRLVDWLDEQEATA